MEVIGSRSKSQEQKSRQCVFPQRKTACSPSPQIDPIANSASITQAAAKIVCSIYSVVQKRRASAHFYRATACNATHGIFEAFLSVYHLCVCLSVRMSVKRVDCDKTKETFAHILIPHEKSFILVYWQEEWLVEATSSTWIFGPNWPRWSENADFQSIFACSASAVTTGEKVQLTLIGSPLYTLSNERKLNIVRCT